MANPQRGEISAVIEGEEKTLCLTLGALAELEARLQAGDLVGLADRFSGGRVTARELASAFGARSGRVAPPSRDGLSRLMSAYPDEGKHG